jgi:predicted TIM-barrel fold metal-dependent hydrolase
LFGSDWPVSLVAARYADVKGALETNLQHLSAAEQAQVFGGSAIEAYRLPDFDSRGGG